MSDNNIKVSALGACYRNDKAEFLEKAILSVLQQTRAADEIVLVVDGPITKDLEAVINIHEKQLKIIRLDENVGLGEALNRGIEHCSYDYIARWDADDILRSGRFELQINEFIKDKSLVMIGGAISEFNCEPRDIKSLRTCPKTYKEIYETAKYKNPFNHVTVMFKKRAITDVGGYFDVAYMEDYNLWLRVIEKHKDIKNINTVLCDVRIGNDMIGRRSGVKNIYSELIMYKLKSRVYGHSIKIIIATISRITLRLMPKFLLKVVYEKLLRER